MAKLGPLAPTFVVSAAVTLVAWTGAERTCAQEAPPPAPTGSAATAAEDPLAPIPADAWTREHAAHLLRRAGFGGPLAAVERLHAMGPDAAVDAVLTGMPWTQTPDADTAAAPPQAAFEVFRPHPDVRRLLRSKSPEERQKLTQQLRRGDRSQLARFRAWWLERMIRTPHPLEEKMVLFWHGHFTSGFREVRSSRFMVLQNELFRRHALGSFAALLREIPRDPAMLRYLDNASNRKQAPNENFARELLELFTLGVGHYTERDIKEAARAFTGWTLRGDRFVIARRQHDDGEKTFLGHTGRLDGDAIIDILLQHPQTAGFISRKLFRFFAHAEPEPRVVEGLAEELRGGGYELAPTLRRLFRSRAFYADRTMRSQIKSPVDLVVGLFRALPFRDVPTTGLSFVTDRLGQSLLQPPNVKGWPGGAAWVNTSTLYARYNTLSAFVGPLTQRASRGLNQAERQCAFVPPAELMADRGPGPATGARDAPDDAAPGPMTGSAMAPEGMQERTPDAEERVGPGADEAAPAPMEGDGAAARRARREARRQQREASRWHRGRRLVDLSGWATSLELETDTEIVDHLCALLLATPLGDAQRQELLGAMRRDSLGRTSPFDLSRADAAPRIEAVVKLIVSMPEFQLQ
jgi:hypothetical protein